ncbi:hypothetical protein CRG98_003158 [Punica granatum]|uniref:Uncharacterized protein n=1 Tax=Punica granatum TaxID=22663 RepID=A0A2I0L6V6_PUNGR|nr:hypothetical protein CRG98_003158 [Punica granatum]
MAQLEVQHGVIDVFVEADKEKPNATTDTGNGMLGGMVGGISDGMLSSIDASMVAGGVDEYKSNEDSDFLAGGNDKTESKESDSSEYGSEATNEEFVKAMKNKKKVRESKKRRRRLVYMDAQNSKKDHVEQVEKGEKD